jgi:enterobacterial common antigen flippase
MPPLLPPSPSAAPLESSREQTDAPSARQSTYGQILKSSVLIGGSSAFNLALGLVRTKAMALLLGPPGFGLMGMYSSIANLAQTIAGMGVNSSGVRQIAAAVGSGDTDCIARTAFVLRRTSVALGLLGAVLLAALSGPVSLLTFQSYGRSASVALLSLAVLFKIVSDGQGALLQGLRRISDLARMAMLAGAFSTVAGVALVYFLRERGVVPSLIAIAGTTLFFSWWFSRDEASLSVAPSTPSVGQEVAALLKLGFAFMASGMLMMGGAYAVRLMVVRQVGLGAAGLYQSAWTIGGLYVGFILQAMAADFYPRLAGVIKDRAECNRLVNEQAEVSLLLAGPGVISTLTFAPLVISLLYSSAFGDAVAILRWVCLGAALQVITWPMGFIIVAEGRQGIFLWCELAYTVVHMGVAWALVRSQGVNGAGIAFCVSYAFHGVMLYPVVRRLTGFRWSPGNRRLGLAFLLTIGLVFCGFYVLPFWLATTVGTIAALLNALYSVRVLAHLVSMQRLPRFLHGPLARLGLGPRNAG